MILMDVNDCNENSVPIHAYRREIKAILNKFIIISYMCLFYVTFITSILMLNGLKCLFGIIVTPHADAAR